MEFTTSRSHENASNELAFLSREARSWDDIRTLRKYVANPRKSYLRIPEVVEMLAKIDILLEQRRKYKSTIFGLTQRVKYIVAASRGELEDDVPFQEATWDASLRSMDDASRFAQAKALFIEISSRIGER